MRRSIQSHDATGGRLGGPAGLRSIQHIVPRRLASVTRITVPVAMTPPMRDYETFDEDEALDGLEAVRLGSPSHYRAIARNPLGSGFSEFCAIADGFFAFIYDVDVASPYRTPFLAPDMVRIRVASESNVEYVTADGDILDMHGPSATITIEPTGMLPAEAVTAGRNRGASVYVHVEALKTLFADSETELPAALHAFLVGELRQTATRRLTLAPALLRCVDDLVDCSLQGRARRLFIQSKAVEILCHAFEALRQEEAAETGENAVLAMRGVLKAQRLLMANFTAPPTLEDLAHEVGMSRSNLCAVFRQTLGQTVFDYIGDLRMERALVLLHQPGASITQIAYEVGYTHPSSFTVAVQRRFGVTPRELRRRNLPAV